MLGFKQLTDKQDPLSCPIISGEELLLWLKKGMAQKTVSENLHLETGYRRSGGHFSPFRGSGLDYDESRLYQPGDDLRNINWRMMARSSDIYTKIYREEREASRLMVIDRRAAMRFGTQKTLKVTHAVEIAACIAGLSIHQGFSVGGMLMQPDGLWVNPERGISKVHQWLISAASACPPLECGISEPELYNILSQLQVRAVAGSHIILISDFHDLNESHVPLLTRLAGHHKILAIQVLDPVEQMLPAQGIWSINGYPQQQSVKISSDDTAIRSAYGREFQKQQQQMESIFSDCRIPFVRIRTDESFDEIPVYLSGV